MTHYRRGQDLCAPQSALLHSPGKGANKTPLGVSYRAFLRLDAAGPFAAARTFRGG
jgi:hypothetical protein